MTNHRPGRDQQRFIGNLQKALAGSAASQGQGRYGHIYPDQGTVGPRSREEQMALLDQVIAESAPINQKVGVHREVSSVAREIKKLVKAKEPEWGQERCIVAWRHPLVEALNLPEALTDEIAAFDVVAVTGANDREKMQKKVSDAYIGITSADFCLADLFIWPY